jgi:hypothetical protein
MQPPLLEGLDDCVEAGGAKRLDGGTSPCQLFVHGDEEVQTLETHMRAWGLAHTVASHLWPDVDDKTRKIPVHGAPTVDVLNH